MVDDELIIFHRSNEILYSIGEYCTVHIRCKLAVRTHNQFTVHISVHRLPYTKLGMHGHLHLPQVFYADLEEQKKLKKMYSKANNPHGGI